MESYQTACCALVCGLPGDLEGDIVGRGVLDLKGGGGGVVEVLGEELEEMVSFATAATGSGGGGNTSLEALARSLNAGIDMMDGEVEDWRG
jgi:hypothetical protein